MATLALKGLHLTGFDFSFNESIKTSDDLKRNSFTKYFFVIFCSHALPSSTYALHHLLKVYKLWKENM